MNRRAAEILERYRSADSLGEADRARLLVAIHERIAAGGSLPAKPGELAKAGEPAKGAAGTAHATSAALAKATALASKVVLGFALVAVPAAIVDGFLIHGRLPQGVADQVQGARRAGSNAGVTMVPVGAGSAALTLRGAVKDSSGPGIIPSIEAEDLPASGPVDARDRAPGIPATRAHGGPRGVATERAMASSGPSNTRGGVAVESGADPARTSAVGPPIAPSPDVTPALAPSPPRPSTSTSTTATSSAANGGTPVDEEVRLVSLAYSLLQAGDPAHALAVLDEHARRFPDGKLAESAKVTRILALCQVGRTSEARSERDGFLSRYPRSPFSNRVRSSCSEQVP
jgi:hypothetical protein